jgi:hypothetical protein
MQNRVKFGSTATIAIATAALAGFLVFSATPVRADDACQRDTAKIDHNLHDAIAHHGPESKEANHWRSELSAQRERCWKSEHKWWDEDAHRWHTERDWDAHDHDH